MPAYIVYFDPTMPVGSRNGVKAALVFAEDAADARAVLKALYSDDLDASWANATVEAVSPGANMVGWTLRVQITTPELAVLVDKEVVGAGANDTMDEIAALMVTALNATAINGAAYNSGTQVLTAAAGSDNIGDHYLRVWFYPPGEVRKTIAGFVGTITNRGSANAALTVALAADAYSVPAVAGKFKSLD